MEKSSHHSFHDDELPRKFRIVAALSRDVLETLAELGAMISIFVLGRQPTPDEQQ